MNELEGLARDIGIRVPDLHFINTGRRGSEQKWLIKTILFLIGVCQGAIFTSLMLGAVFVGPGVTAANLTSYFGYTVSGIVGKTFSYENIIDELKVWLPRNDYLDRVLDGMVSVVKYVRKLLPLFFLYSMSNTIVQVVGSFSVYGVFSFVQAATRDYRSVTLPMAVRIADTVYSNPKNLVSIVQSEMKENGETMVDALRRSIDKGYKVRVDMIFEGENIENEEHREVYIEALRQMKRDFDNRRATAAGDKLTNDEFIEVFNTYTVAFGLGANVTRAVSCMKTVLGDAVERGEISKEDGDYIGDYIQIIGEFGCEECPPSPFSVAIVLT